MTADHLRRQLRMHHWVKNLLVFLPVIAGRKVFDAAYLLEPLLAFFMFSLTASGVYVFNDLMDVDDDRRHRTKSRRPLASGALSPREGVVLAGFLTSLSLTVSWYANPLLGMGISSYLLLNVFYTVALKKFILVDIFALSVMYTLRIYTGGLVCGIVPSLWLLSFSTAFFFSLACGKRWTELNQPTFGAGASSKRGYLVTDLSVIKTLGIASALLSVLVVVLYLQVDENLSMYRSPVLMWCLGLVLLYWLLRFWILVNRSQVDDDPVIFALKDRVTWACLSLVAVFFGASIA